jgi:hypothetical protein
MSGWRSFITASVNPPARRVAPATLSGDEAFSADAKTFFKNLFCFTFA